MLRKFLHTCTRCRVPPRFTRFTVSEPFQNEPQSQNEVAVFEDNQIPTRILNEPKRSVLEKCEEDISHVAPNLKPTFNFAAYVNQSDTLKQLVNLGVDLHKLEKMRDVPPFILGLDFDRDVKNHILFFHDLGIDTEIIANIFTKNPLILKEDLEDLRVRVNYLQSKRFSDEMIVRLISANPMWLSFSTQKIDEALGFFQTNYHLSGKEVRDLAVKCPRLITYNNRKVKLNTFVLKEEMGFKSAELKMILLDTPLLFIKEQKNILRTFEYVHRIMKIPLETIVKMPKILTCREFRMKQRHLFLKTLGKDQFNPKEPNYISVETMVLGSDAHFCTEVAGSTIQAYNAFLKTL